MKNVRSVERAIKILKVISTSENGLTVSEISSYLDLNSTTIIRLLATLEKEDLVARDIETLAYKLGNTFIEISKSALYSENIINIAYPIMQELVEDSKETVALFVIRGTKRICVSKVEGLHPIRYHIEIGDTAPLGISSSGKLLLAFSSQYVIDSILKKQLFLRDGEIVNPENLKKELDNIKVKRCAISFCENSLDGVGISASIKNAMGKTIASLTILGPASRIAKKDDIESYKNMLIAKADKISLAMGYDACTMIS